MQVLQDARAAVIQSEERNITLLLGGRGLTEEMLVEGVRNIARVADSDADLELKQLERDLTHRYKLSSNLRVCEQVFAVPLNVQEILCDCQTFAVFVPNGRCAKGPGAIVAWAI